MRNKSGVIWGSLLLLASCGVPKDITYFQGIDKVDLKQMPMNEQVNKVSISTDDLLTINISSWDPSVVAPYNPPAYGYYPQGETQYNNSVHNFYTYLVDSEGDINFPILGKIKLAGLTIQEANKKLQSLIAKDVPDALVNIQIINFKVGIFGEVARSNIYTIRNNRISIVDLIAQAGDLTINANRKNLLLIRRDNSGKSEHVRIDLTDPTLFASPYFYLKQNDILYVEPNDAKKRNANYSSAQQYSLTIVSTILSGISVISSTIIAIIATNKK